MRPIAWSTTAVLAAAVVGLARPAHADPQAQASSGPRPQVFVGLSVGTGYGWAKGHGEVNVEIPFSGWSRAALLHLSPEIGFYALSWLAFSVEGRYQIVRGTTDFVAPFGTFHAAREARAVFAEAIFFLRAPERRLRPYLFAGTGLGRIRHLAALPVSGCGPQSDQSCVDTVSGGSYLSGYGAGLHYRLWRWLDATAAIAFQFGSPGPWTLDMFNVDGNLGLAAVF